MPLCLDTWTVRLGCLPATLGMNSIALASWQPSLPRFSLQHKYFVVVAILSNLKHIKFGIPMKEKHGGTSNLKCKSHHFGKFENFDPEKCLCACMGPRPGFHTGAKAFFGVKIFKFSKISGMIDMMSPMKSANGEDVFLCF